MCVYVFFLSLAFISGRQTLKGVARHGFMNRVHTAFFELLVLEMDVTRVVKFTGALKRDKYTNNVFCRHTLSDP